MRDKILQREYYLPNKLWRFEFAIIRQLIKNDLQYYSYLNVLADIFENILEKELRRFVERGYALFTGTFLTQS